MPSPPGIADGGRRADGEWQPRSLRWDSRLFDEKVAANDLYRWDGGDKGADSWRGRVRDYVIGKCHLLRPMMDWAESMEYMPCTKERIDEQYAYSMVDVNESIDIMAMHLWSWLRMCLSGTALAAFKVAPEFNGLDA